MCFIWHSEGARLHSEKFLGMEDLQRYSTALWFAAADFCGWLPAQVCPSQMVPQWYIGEDRNLWDKLDYLGSIFSYQKNL